MLRCRCLFIVVLVTVGMALSGEVAAKRCPNVMFVLDTSKAMLLDPQGGGQLPSRWDFVVSAISQVVNGLGTRLHFGLVTASSSGGSDVTCFADTQLHAVCGTVINPAVFVQKLQGAAHLGVANTGDGIKRAYLEGGLKDLTRDNHIILITASDPVCNGMDPTYTINEIAAAAALNPSVHTWVIGFDGIGGASPKNLDQMALAGKTAVANCVANKVPCYQKFSPMALDLVLQGIFGNLPAACDDSCFSEPCPVGEVCAIRSDCAVPACVPDLCAGMTCDNDMYCKDGHCYRPCPLCLKNEYCEKETCRPDPCAGQVCQPDQVCDRARGACTSNLCTIMRPVCPLPSACDPLVGCCKDDPCRLVNCPPDSTCTPTGYCQSDPPKPPRPPDLDFGFDPDMSVATETPDLAMPGLAEAGCSCDLGGHASRRAHLPLSSLLLIASLALVLVRWRHR